MKKFIILSLFFFSGLVSFCQSKPKNPKEDSLVKKAAKSKPTTPTVQPANSNTIVFVMTPEQVKLLEYVITESGASFKATNQLLDILRTQQYHPPVESADSSSKVIPKVPSDSTAGKKN